MKTIDKHPMHEEIEWLRRNHPFIEVSNNTPGGYLVISVGRWETGGSGRIFTQDQMRECIEYVKKIKQKNHDKETI